MYPASLILLVAAGMTLVLGTQRDDVGVLLLSIGCSALATVSVGAAVVRRLRRDQPASGD